MDKNLVDYLSLADIDPGDEVVVRKINLPAKIRRRLLDLGILPGVRVVCTACAPCGRPKAYFVSSSTVAIRLDDAKEIEVEYVNKNENKSQKREQQKQ